MSKTTTAQQDTDRLIDALRALMDDLEKGERGRLARAFADDESGWFEDVFGPIMAAVGAACLNSARRRAQAVMEEAGR